MEGGGKGIRGAGNVVEERGSESAEAGSHAAGEQRELLHGGRVTGFGAEIKGKEVIMGVGGKEIGLGKSEIIIGCCGLGTFEIGKFEIEVVVI